MNMHKIWSQRFASYVNEVQKYMRYIFTGHIAVVLVFLFGALTYQYSEWLKVVDTTFPVEWVVGIVIGLILTLSKPTTLLKEPDQVYLLPLERQMKEYFSKALRWTFFSQILVPVILYVALIPLIRSTTDLTVGQIWLGVAFIILLKILNVISEFGYRYANRGQVIILDRHVRFVFNMAALFYFIQNEIMMALIFAALFVFYYVSIKKKVYSDPVPYEHFVSLEQNRMYSFYRFANYFTDVPHLKGEVKRRKYLDFLYSKIAYNKLSSQVYLVSRTFVRTNDLFYLFVRLTFIAAIFALFIEIQFVTWIVSAIIAFATVYQLKIALKQSGEFRMDMLYPVQQESRTKAVNQVLIAVLVVQTIVVTACNIQMPLFFITPVVMLTSGLITLKMTK